MSGVHSAYGIRIFYKEARTLQGAGYDVVVIARHSRNEVLDGIKIVALPTYSSRILRILGTARVLRLALRERADVYHFLDPELLPCGIALKILTKKKVVYDVLEHYTKFILHKYWIPRLLRRPASVTFGLLETILVRKTDYVIYTTRLIGEKYQRMGLRTESIQDFPDLEQFSGIFRTQQQGIGVPIILYLGAISRERGALETVLAFAKVSKSVPHAELMLVGNIDHPREFKDEILDLVSKLDIEGKVKIVPYVPYREVNKFLAEACVGMVTLLPVPNHLNHLPIKLFEYMASGLPVVASDFPLYREVLEEVGCGVLVDPTNPDEIAEAVLTVLGDESKRKVMSERGRRFFETKYNWGNERKKLLRVYAELLGEQECCS